MTESAKRPERIGIFGGTFDPPHRGHAIVAGSVRRQFSLDRIIFVPSFISPHKQEWETASGEARLEMLDLLIRGIPGLEASDCEIRRAGVSYTIDTLRFFHDRYPSATLCLLVGMDNLAEFGSWREPEEILRLATLVVMTRPGSGNIHAEEKMADRMLLCNVPAISISSTGIRALIRDGKPIRHLVPDALGTYIERHKLYIPGDSLRS